MNTIDYNNPDKYLLNYGQNTVGPCAQEFADKIEKIENIEDLKLLIKLFRENIRQEDPTSTPRIPKFVRTTEEIFESKIRSGCSDIGTAIAPILRIKGIPTVYLQSANIDWIKDFNENNKNASPIRGHIFLEIFIGGEWALFDPTKGNIYTGYDPYNLNLPEKYYAFTKSLNGHEIGYTSQEANRNFMHTIFKGFDIGTYDEPQYVKIDLNDNIIKKI